MKLQNQRISVICTALSIETLNEFWKSRPGFHFFQMYIKIPSPSKVCMFLKLCFTTIFHAQYTSLIVLYFKWITIIYTFYLITSTISF